MKRFMKITALLLCLLLAVAGCGGGGAPAADGTTTAAPASATTAAGTTTGAAVTTAAAGTTAAGTTAGAAATTAAPAAGDTAYPAELSIYTPLNSWLAKAANDMNGSEAYTEMSRITGTKINWIHPPASADYQQQLSILVMTGDLPDIISVPWMGTSIVGGVRKYAEDNVIIELTPYYEGGKMPNVTRLFDEYPVIKKQILQDDGKLYYMCTVRKDDPLRIWNGPQIRVDYLEKVGMEIPDTVDDLYEVLKAFKEQKVSDAPNFVPMMAGTWSDISQGIVQLVYSFGISNSFYMDDGTVKYGPLEPAFKDAIAYIRKMLDEELIDRNYVTNNRDIIDAAMVADEAGFMFNTQVTKLALLFEGRGMENPLKPIPYLRGPNPTSDLATVFYPEAGSNVANNGLSVTTKAKDPDGAVAWIDFLYGPEGEQCNNFGIEGVSYTMVDGKEILTELVTNNPNWDINTASAVYTPAKVGTFPGIQRYASWVQSSHPDGVACVEEYMSRVDTSFILPPVSLTDAEQAEFANVMTDIQTYIAETIDKILLGQMELSELDNMITTIKEMGIDRAIAVNQAALDRYNAR